MKRILMALLMALLMATLLFTGCGSSGTAQQSADDGKAEDFETTDYLFESSDGYTVYFYVVKNNTKDIVDVEATAKALDSAGKELGSDKESIDVLGPGETSIMMFYYDDVTGVDKVDCQMTTAQETYYTPVLSNIKTEDTINGQHVTIVAKNEGDIPAQFVEAYVLFFDKDNNIVAYDSSYVTDSDAEFKPGSTLATQLGRQTDFDHVEYYLTGKYDGTEPEDNGVSDSDFAVKEYYYEGSSGDSMCFLALTNNGDKTVSIEGNLIAYDAKGKVLGAAYGSLDVIGPGEESLMDFYLDGVQDMDKVEYTLSYDTEPLYDSCLKDLEFTHDVNDRDISVTITNKGADPAQFTQAHVLCLDADGKVVLEDSTYFTDDDNELKPGATQTEEFSSYKEFDSVVVYLTARKEAA